MDFNKTIIANSLLIIAYYFTGKLVGLLSFPPVGAISLWVPAGIAVGAVLIWGYRLLPAAFLGDFLIGVDLYGLQDPSSVLLAISLGAQSALLAWIALSLARKFDVWPSFLVMESQILRFYLIVGLFAPVIPTLLITAVQFGLDLVQSDGVFESFFLRWLGTAIGIVIFTPVFLTFFASPEKVWRLRLYNVGIPTLVLFLMLIIILNIAKNRDQEFNSGRFQTSVGLVNTSLDYELTYHEDILNSLLAFFNGSEYVSQQEFAKFLNDVFPHRNETQLFGWIERRQDPGYPDKDAFVIQYLQNYGDDPDESKLAELKGFNLCQLVNDSFCESQNRVNTVRIQDLLKSVLAADDKLLYLMPVEKNGQNRGFIFYQYSDGIFLNGKKTGTARLIDYVMTDIDTGKVVHDSRTFPHALPTYLDINFKSTRFFSFADRSWKLEFYPSHEFIVQYASWSYYWIVGAGLMVFLLAGIWLMTMTGRYNLVKHEVDEKTKKLREHSRLLADSENKYRNLVESIQDEYFLYRHDTDGYFHYVSPSIEKILGYTQGEFLNHYSTYLPDTDVNRLVDDYTQRTLAGNKSNYEVEILSKNGDLHTLAVTEMPCYDAQDTIIGVEGIAHDITDLKASQLELEKLSLAVQHSPNAIIIFDKEGIIEYVNPKFTAITGYSKKEALEKWPDLTNSKINSRGVYREIWDTISAGHEWRGELQNRKKNGDLYWAQELIAPMLNQQGKVTHYVATLVDITEARRLSEETSYQASHDLLTGLINRREFDRRLERVIQIAKRDQSEHVLCYLDLDQFKVINDTCGHTAGDELLRQVGALLQANVRARDTIARLGGDEFAILMEYCSIEQAYKVCEQILELLRDYRFHWQDYTFTIGGSIGVMIIDHYTQDGDEALRTVDTACYAAKDAGRNRVEVYREDSERLKQRQGEIQWSAEISEALDQDRFLLYAQPIKPLMNLQLNTSYEILVRMQRRDGEISPPGAFLPAAERYNTITHIDRWVITHTLELLKQHVDKLNHVGTISINLSGLTLSDNAMREFIINSIEQSGVPAEKIKFEITETAAIANLRTATSLIERMHEKGIFFSLDDFGSGLSSFAYLKKMKVDALKIDGIFVKDMLDDPLDYEMVKAINEIGHVMGLRTIAEYVENDDILQKLREMGVDYAQGYATGKPVPIDDILDNVT